MQVILTKEVLGLGDPGETVTVKNGYARNYLIPKGFALQATKKNMVLLESERKRLETQQAKEAETVRAEAAGINGAKVTIAVRAGETGKLYGSVATKDIAAALAELGHDVDRRRIMLDTAIKDLGEYPVKIKLHPQVFVEIAVVVEGIIEKSEVQIAEAAPAAEVAEADEAAEEAGEAEEELDEE